MTLEQDETNILESAFRKAAERIGMPEPETPTAPSLPRGYVFPGTMPRPSTSIPESAPVQNRRPTRRRYSPFNVVLWLLLAAIASVLYISNVIAVGRLAAEIGTLDDRYRSIINEQEMLRAEIVRLSSLERVRRIGEERFGMNYSEAVPGWLTVDPERVKELESIARSSNIGDIR